MDDEIVRRRNYDRLFISNRLQASSLTASLVVQLSSFHHEESDAGGRHLYREKGSRMSTFRRNTPTRSLGDALCLFFHMQVHPASYQGRGAGVTYGVRAQTLSAYTRPHLVQSLSFLVSRRRCSRKGRIL